MPMSANELDQIVIKSIARSLRKTLLADQERISFQDPMTTKERVGIFATHLRTYLLRCGDDKQQKSIFEFLYNKKTWNDAGEVKRHYPLVGRNHPVTQLQYIKTWKMIAPAANGEWILSYVKLNNLISLARKHGSYLSKEQQETMAIQNGLDCCRDGIRDIQEILKDSFDINQKIRYLLRSLTPLPMAPYQ